MMPIFGMILLKRMAEAKKAHHYEDQSSFIRSLSKYSVFLPISYWVLFEGRKKGKNLGIIFLRALA